MSQRTALFLAGLSHQWFGIVVLLVFALGLASFFVGRERARAAAGGARLQVWTAGRIVVNALLAFSIATFAVAFFHVGCATLVSNASHCHSNEKQLALALFTYAQDYNEHFPPSNRWSEAIVPYLNGTSDTYKCPAAETPASYGMNSLNGGIGEEKINDPAATVLLFEADAAKRSFAGGPRDVAKNRHSGGSNVAFADGHVKNVFGEGFYRLVWPPTATPGSSH